MPRRSNEFQGLVLRIYAAMERVRGAKVEESVLLKEEGTDDAREVDVLVSRPVGERVVKIAIEARDHSRDQDVTWVDSLIGKFSGLGVDAVVAVSHTPFTPSAARKAARHRIKLLELREAERSDWAKELGPGLLNLFTCDPRPMVVAARLCNEVIFKFELSYEGEIKTPDVREDFVWLWMWVWHGRVRHEFGPQFISNALADWERVLAMERSLRYVEWEERFDEIQGFTQAATGRRFEFDSLVWGIGIRFTAETIAPSRWALGDGTIADFASVCGINNSASEMTLVTCAASGASAMLFDGNPASPLPPPSEVVWYGPPAHPSPTPAPSCPDGQ